MDSIRKFLLFLCTCGESEKSSTKDILYKKTTLPRKKEIKFEDITQTSECYVWGD